MSARQRVGALVQAARRAFVEERSESLVAELAAESGLSPEGVVLALDRVLEHDADEHAIARFVAKAPARTAVSVVLAANVFVAPLRAVAWALAHSGRVTVRTSRRARRFTARLLESAPTLVENVVHASPSDDPEADLESLVAALPIGGALHVYGGEGAVDAARRATAGREDLALDLHGPGFGAIVATAAELAAQADDVAFDVSVFDQRGCLSPRVALVLGGGDALGPLAQALGRFGQKVPRGELDPATRSALRRAVDAATFAEGARVGPHHAVLAHGYAETLPLPPAGRALALVTVADLDGAIALLRAHAHGLASIGAPRALHAALASAFPFVRLAELGAMQRPPLDGPVDRRTWP
jgi:hypothetical protein